MDLHNVPPQSPRVRFVLYAGALTSFLVILGAAIHGQQTKLDFLRIGTSGTWTTATADKKKDEAALDSLKDFIKEETGFKSEIMHQKDWRELADKMAKGQLQLGVFQGYEFAWAQDKRPALKPLALAINVHRYPVVCVVVKRDNAAKDFAGLQGQSLALPDTGDGYLRLYVEKQSQAGGKTPEVFFSKIISPTNFEDALDDVVDGMVQAVVTHRAALEAYKRRKPGRFDKLQEVAQSQPFPPAVVAYYDKILDEATLKRFQDGLLGASSKDKGQTLLTLFRLTGFETVPADFGKVLAETSKTYPPPSAKTK